MELDKALGKAFRDVRSSKALTQEFFSDVTSRRHISRLENGQSDVTVAFIDKVAQSMNVHPLTILTLAYLNTNEKVDFEKLQRIIQTELFQVNRAIITKTIE